MTDYPISEAERHAWPCGCITDTDTPGPRAMECGSCGHRAIDHDDERSCPECRRFWSKAADASCPDCEEPLDPGAASQPVLVHVTPDGHEHSCIGDAEAWIEDTPKREAARADHVDRMDRYHAERVAIRDDWCDLAEARVDAVLDALPAPVADAVDWPLRQIAIDPAGGPNLGIAAYATLIDAPPIDYSANLDNYRPSVNAYWTAIVQAARLHSPAIADELAERGDCADLTLSPTGGPVGVRTLRFWEAAAGIAHPDPDPLLELAARQERSVEIITKRP